MTMPDHRTWMSHEFLAPHCCDAERVYLLLRLHRQFTQLIPMDPPEDAGEPWHIRIDLPAGDHEYRLYAYAGGRLTLCTPLQAFPPADGPEDEPAASPPDTAPAPSRGNARATPPRTPAIPPPIDWPDRWTRFPASRPSDSPYGLTRGRRRSRLDWGDADAPETDG